ncbi:uncharacterized protein LOC110995616 [Pieris rapae]|uniref:uncharacterized protein LOC110995616 n=1 Tax=Pieris rapae TaxID=64459 RepID=UPI001E27A938|nr:uncharacterized protein LOC110995616 [Pieris rapae]
MEWKLYITGFVSICCLWYANAAVNCTGNGRFPHLDDPLCKSYYMCVYLPWSGSYVHYNYTCPSTSLFNPTTAQCTSNYTCNRATCTAVGRIPDLSTNCSGYIDCIYINGAILENRVKCPGNSLFNPASRDCEFTFSCTPVCLAVGRFPDTKVPGCKNYYMCIRLGNGTLVSYTNYTCPSISVFNPNTQVCTTNYTCTT